MQVAPKGSTFPEITHHEVELNRTKLHYVAASEFPQKAVIGPSRASGNVKRNPLMATSIGIGRVN